MTSKNPSLLRRYFAGIAENTFHTRLGVVDPDLIDYLSDLLTRFARSETMFRIRSMTGKPLRDVGEMLLEAHERVGDARREVHRHIGDFTLFWTGVYPESLRRMRRDSGDLVNFREEGKRSYWIASRIETEEPRGATPEVLHRLSEQYELCAYGLREVRRVWEERDGGDPPETILFN